MKKIPLTPYPGIVLVTTSREEFAKEYKRQTGEDGGHFSKSVTGRMQPFFREGFAPVYLIFYQGRVSTLVHELAHVVLRVFEDIGTDPCSGGGEPFCYLQAHLYEEVVRR